MLGVVLLKGLEPALHGLTDALELLVVHLHQGGELLMQRISGPFQRTAHLLPPPLGGKYRFIAVPGEFIPNSPLEAFLGLTQCFHRLEDLVQGAVPGSSPAPQ